MLTEPAGLARRRFRAGNANTRFNNVSLLSVASTLPSRVTTSEDLETRLAPAFSRLALPSRLLQRVAGVLERRNWAAGETSDDATVSAGQRALADAGVDASEVGLLINPSVSREHLVEFGERVAVAPRLRTS
ncbi:hypothetical protein NYA9BBAC_01231 [Salinibacterium sp. NYA9b]